MYFFRLTKKNKDGYAPAGWLKVLGGKEQAILQLLVDYPEITQADIVIEFGMTEEEFKSLQERQFQGD